MAAAKDAKERAPRRRWPPAEKRRIVELTLRAGASVRAIAGEHGVHPTSLNHWKSLYRAGKLDAQVKSAARVPGPAASATFVPVNVLPAVRRSVSELTTHPDAAASRSSIVQLALASGATLRIETGALDADFVCALVAELRR
jgi:transposase-like protein